MYRAISEGVINLADQFFDMDRIDARKGLEMYREAIESTERLQSFFNAIQSMPAGNQMTFPQLQPPPSDFLTQMEEYVKGAKGPEMAKTVSIALVTHVVFFLLSSHWMLCLTAFVACNCLSLCK